MYERLREADPGIYHARTGEWVILRYDDVRRLSRDERLGAIDRAGLLRPSLEFYRGRGDDLGPVEEAMSGFMLLMEAPSHRRLRHVLTDSWTKNDLMPMVSAISDKLITRLEDGDLDFISNYADLLPAMVISEVLGLRENDFDRARNGSAAMLQSLEPFLTYKKIVGLGEGARDFTGLLRDMLKTHQASSRDSFAGKLMSHLADGSCSEPELISLMIFLFVAGAETTASAIGTALLNLLQNPKVFQQIRDDPALLDSAVEELLRFDNPVQHIGRIALEPIEVLGHLIPEGATLSLCIGSANRDPRFFEDPDRLVLEREPRRHLSFGFGRHHCFGASLARLELRIALDALITNFSKIELCGTDRTWKPGLAVRGLDRLMISVQRA
jgi:cytochrome P450